MGIPHASSYRYGGIGEPEGVTMQIAKFAFVAALGFALAGCVTTQDKVKAQWNQMWDARLASYKTTQPEQANAAERTLKEAVSASPEYFQDAIAQFFRAVYQKGVADGRTIALDGFNQYRAQGASPNMLFVWASDQLDKAQAWSGDIEAKWIIHSRAGEKGPLPDGYFVERRHLIESAGLSDGLQEEMRRVRKEIAGFNSDLTVAAAEDDAHAQRAAAAMMMFGQGMQNTAAQMQQMNFQNQLLQSINRPVTCHRVGTFTNCY